MLPYMMENIPKVAASSGDGALSLAEMSLEDKDGNYTVENSLSNDEARQLWLSIKDLLCEAPYSCAMIL